jgi:hypothetical protein
MPNENCFVCPVCGFPNLYEAPYDAYGHPSFEICPSCGTEFGYHDANRTHAELRKQWIAAGTPWHSDVKAPLNWDPIQQLRSAGLQDALEN